MLILGIDVSTTTAGWSLLEAGNPVPRLGYISLGKFDCLYTKAGEFEKEMRKILSENKVNAVYVEEDLQKFQKGMSSAAVIQKLSRFNGMACLIIYQITGNFPIHIGVNEARKKINCKIDKKDKKRTTKEKVLEWVQQDLKDYAWPTKVLSSGPRKGTTVFLPECFDMADGYVISKAALKL